MATDFVICLVVSLFLFLYFSGIAVAFMYSDKLSHLISDMRSGAYSFILNSFYKYPRRFMIAMVVGQVISLTLSILFFFLIIRSSVLMDSVSEWLVMLLFVLVSVIVLFLLGEVVPNVAFRKNSNLWLKVLALPTFLFYVVLYPIGALFVLLSRGVLRIFGIKDDEPSENSFGGVDIDEYFKKNFDDIANEDDVDSEVKIFRNAMDFSNMKVRDCMVPRAYIVAVDKSIDAESLREKFIETGISRILVYDGDIDNIVGYMHMWEMFSLSDDWTSSIASLSFVPESMLASKLMSDLMQQRKSIAVVVDEFGGTSGIVTMEDLVEEIFGDIEDEYDVKSKFIKQENDHELVMSGRVELDQLNEKYGLDIPESDDYSTIAGYLLHHTQRFPKTYETIVIGKYTFKILKVTERRIEVVKIII